MIIFAWLNINPMNTLYEIEALLKASLVLSVPTEVGQSLECCSSRSKFSNRNQDTKAESTNDSSKQLVKRSSKRTGQLELMKSAGCIVRRRENGDCSVKCLHTFHAPVMTSPPSPTSSSCLIIDVKKRNINLDNDGKVYQTS